ncbi:MAG TPA: M23 family metallopeptidase [Nitrospirales bacterium]|nr:M23 family metallopeptidase [Nitrospirales bacterium]
MKLDRFLIMSVVVIASVFPVDLLPGTPHAPRGVNGQYSGRQGEVLVVMVPASGSPQSVEGRLLNRRIPFFKDPSADDRYVGLVGLDLEDTPGNHELTVDIAGEHDRRYHLSYNVLIIRTKYPVQHLTLPKDKVDLDEDSLARVKLEQDQVKTVFEAISQQRFWKETFIQPVQGPSTGQFGRLRVINGQPRNPHNGEDIAAPMGTDVVAMNDGIVRLTADHFFSGKGVFLDHGLGLYSMYFHLSDVTVQDGQTVKRGDVIGKVGASGRASGPHLHWGVRINGARVDPYALLKLSFQQPLP